MKAGTTELLKFKRLQRRLGEGRRGTVGLLELLWQGTARNAPTGDIGRFTNEEIAILCDYEGDPDRLVEALVDCGWLDESEEHRLIVHDWCDHCPTYVKGAMARHGKQLAKQPAIATSSEQAAKQPAESESAGSSEEASTKPIQAYPSQAKPKTDCHPSGGLPDEPYTEEFIQFWEACPSRKGKLKAFEAFRRAKKRCGSRLMREREPPAEFLTRRMLDYAASVAGVEARFIKHPATWLNGGCWDDETVSRLPTPEENEAWTPY